MCILNTIYWLLFSVIQAVNIDVFQEGSPQHRGLKASGLQRRQSCGKTHKHKTNQ